MSVEIDLSGASIPGFPNKMEIKNAAQEETLKEILKLMEQQKKTADKSLKALEKSAGTAGASQGGSSKGTEANDKAQADAAKSTKKNIAGMEKMGKGVGMIAASAMRAAPALNALAIGSARLVREFSDVGDSLTSASNALSNIKLVGPLLSATLGAVASNAEKVYGNFTKLASTGATFDGSMRNMVNAATGAGLTLDQFTGILAQSGQALMFLGGTTEEGAKRFAEIGKVMRTSGLQTELLKLGFTTTEVNEGMAAYAGTFGKVSNIQNMSTQELAESSASYMKELDVLAKITGATRQEKQKEMDAIVADEQMRALLLGKSKEEQEALTSFVGSFPKAAQGAMIDMIATGSATKKETREFAAMNHQGAAAAMALGAAHRRNEKLSKEDYHNAEKTIKLGAKQNQETHKIAALNNTAMKGASGIQMEIAAMDQNAREKALSEQGKVAAQTEDLAKNLGKLKQDIAMTGNKFALALLDDAAIESLRFAFKSMSDFVMAFVVPVFKITIAVLNPFITIIGGVVMVLSKSLGPALNIIASVIGAVSGLVSKALNPAFEGLAFLAEYIVTPALAAWGIWVAWSSRQTIIASAKSTLATLSRIVAEKAATGAAWLNVAATKASTLAMGRGAIVGKLMTVLGLGLKGLAAVVGMVSLPILGIVAAIAVAVGAVYLVIKYWDDIVGYVSDLGTKLKNVFASVINMFSSLASKLNPMNWFKGTPEEEAEKKRKREEKRQKAKEDWENSSWNFRALAEKKRAKQDEAEHAKKLKTTYTVNGQEVDKETYDKQMSGMDKMTKGLDKVAESNKHLDETLAESNKLEEDANKKTPQAHRLSPGSVRPQSAAQRAQSPGSPSAPGGGRSAAESTARGSGGLSAAIGAEMSAAGGSAGGSSGSGGGSSGAKDAGNFTKTGTPGSEIPTSVGKPTSGGGMSEQEIKDMIIDHEGIRYKPYKDSLGLWTVGVGHLIGDGKSLPPEFDREFSHDEVMAMFEKDYASHRKAAERIPGFGAMNGRGQGAMTDLTFNMGNAWIRGWPRTRKMLEAGNMNGAADELAGSKWAGQVGRRAPIIIDHVRNGIQAAEGGVFSGPKSGYPATLHGDEAVVPLKGGNIPVEMGNANQAEMINLLSTLNNKMEQLVQLNAAIADLNTDQLKAQKRMGNTELLV